MKKLRLIDFKNVTRVKMVLAETRVQPWPQVHLHPKLKLLSWPQPASFQAWRGTWGPDLHEVLMNSLRGLRGRGTRAASWPPRQDSALWGHEPCPEALAGGLVKGRVFNKAPRGAAFYTDPLLSLQPAAASGSHCNINDASWAEGQAGWCPGNGTAGSDPTDSQGLLSQQAPQRGVQRLNKAPWAPSGKREAGIIKSKDVLLQGLKWGGQR